MGLFKPKWMNADETKALTAIQGIKDEKILYEVALNCPHCHAVDVAIAGIRDERRLYWLVRENKFRIETRMAALHKINDDKLLTNIAMAENVIFTLRVSAVKQISEQSALECIARFSDDASVRSEAVERVTVQTALENIAIYDTSATVHSRAVRRLTNQTELARAAKDRDAGVRMAAVERLDDQPFLGDIALNDRDNNVRKTATEQLKDQLTLAHIALRDANEAVRRTAIEKLIADDVLLKAATSDKSVRNRESAVARLNDQTALEKIFSIDESERVRAAAILRMKDGAAQASAVLREHFSFWVRQYAVENIGDRSALECIVRRCDDAIIRMKALKQLMKVTDSDASCADEKLIEYILDSDNLFEYQNCIKEIYRRSGPHSRIIRAFKEKQSSHHHDQIYNNKHEDNYAHFDFPD